MEMEKRGDLVASIPAPRTASDFLFRPSDYPARPGCYLMKDGRSRVIYVGKAKSLRHRLSSYFQPALRDRKARRMIACVRSIEIIIVNNEYESLVLENNLIKRYKPRFNRILKKETSGYFYIQLTGEKYPRFLRYRKNRYVKAVQGLQEPNESVTFGPYLRSRHRETLLEYINDNYRLRTCKPLGHQVCLRFHLGRCSGICERRVSDADYIGQVAQAAAFLSRSQEGIVAQMRERMSEYAAHLRYEQAQKVRDQIAAMEEGLQKQIVEANTAHDQDVLYFGADYLLTAHIRRGVMQGLSWRRLPAGAAGMTGPERHCRFILSHYASDSPDELITNLAAAPADLTALACQLSSSNRRTIRVTAPRQGLAADLLQLCRRNFEHRRRALEAM